MSVEAERDIVVLGGANSDYMVRGPKLPAAGETLEGEAFLEAPGGKGANQAVAAARLGVRVTFLSRLGTDARGDRLLEGLRAAGIDTSHVVRDEHAPSGAALIMVDGAGQKQIFAAPGAIKAMVPTDVQAASPAIRDARILLSQLEAPLEVVGEAMRLARESGTRTVLDTAPPAELPDSLLANVDVIRCNAAEAEALTGIAVRDATSAERAARQLMQRGAGAAIVEASESGNLVTWRDGVQLLPRLPVQSIDATGAGDAFAAALAVLLAEGFGLLEAAKGGNAAAALATTKWGAQAGLPTRAELRAFVKNAYGIG